MNEPCAEAALPAPADMRRTFSALAERDAEAAVRYLHDLGTSSGYIRQEDVARNIRWTSATVHGVLELTINLSKPEKDPRAIAAAARTTERAAQRGSRRARAPEREASENAACSGEASRPAGQPAPLCDLCWENEGWPGSPEHPAKPGLRIAAIALGGETWGLQFSPYAYFDEHCIALSRAHRPMKVDAACLERLLDFVDQFPFYFIGSNADLPIVGGSILSHDHFQGGRHTFPLMKAPLARAFRMAGLPSVKAGVVAWPASTIRLSSPRREDIAQAANTVLRAWRDHDDEACGIRAFTGNEPHNALNPILRKADGAYELHLVLRNNRASAERPWGLFHPAEELHHIKKENIGLVEIMGQAILPPRLARELPAVDAALADAAARNVAPNDLQAHLANDPLTAPHALWAAQILTRRAGELAEQAAVDRAFAHRGGTPPLCPVMRDEVAAVFAQVLEATGVFKQTEAGQLGWTRFLDKLVYDGA